MDLLTKISIDEPKQRIEHSDAVMFMGSCFASNVGEHFERNKFSTIVNPFGVVYNPVSVANALELLISDQTIPEHTFIEHKGLWHSFFHHSSFSSQSLSECKLKIEEERSNAAEFLKHADYLFITFGTSWVFEHIQTGLLVSNCHKIPAKEFNRYRLNIDEIVAQYKELIVKLKVFNPNIKIVFTVSPIRHWKDGAHGNQLSKSVLLLAIEQLCERFDMLSYFPSYEIVMDELRDYRFYAQDMLHLNEQAVAYIWERFTEKWLSRQAMEVIKKVEDILKAVNHKPFNPEGEAYKTFIQDSILKALDLEKRLPYLDFYDEKRILNDRISR